MRKISKLAKLNINWDETSDLELCKQTGLARHTIYQYRKLHNLPLGPKRISDKYKNGGRKKIDDIDHIFAFAVKAGIKKGSTIWKKAVINYYGPECKICGYYKPLVKNHCHHRKFISQGGLNTIRNGIVVCSRCHDEIHAGLISLT